MEGLRLENKSDTENVLTVLVTVQGFEIGVSDEKAVDSYNSTFECYFNLSMDEATELMKFLQKNIKPPRGRP